LAIPGYWWLARRRRDVASLSVLSFLALLVPAAAHTLHAAGTTPMRLIVAVVPMGAVPLAEFLSVRGKSRFVQAAFICTAILSLDNALAYNLHHYKGYGPLVDWSFSGWKVNLLFPNESRTPWISIANGTLFVTWLVVLTALFFVQRFERGAAHDGSTAQPATIPSLSRVALAFAVLGFLGTGVSAATRNATRASYMIPAPDAAERAALQVDDMGGRAIVASSRGRVRVRALMAYLEGVAPSVAARRHPGLEWAYDEWLSMPGRIRTWYNDANGRDPGSEDLGHYFYQWREERVAPAEIRRRIFAAAGKTMPPEPVARGETGNP